MTKKEIQEIARFHAYAMGFMSIGILLVLILFLYLLLVMIIINCQAIL
jgi:hypothetical protein